MLDSQIIVISIVGLSILVEAVEEVGAKIAEVVAEVAEVKTSKTHLETSKNDRKKRK